MARHTRTNARRPAKDEWGVYDPQQAGLAALYARLDMRKESAAPVQVPEPAAKEPKPVSRPAPRHAQ